MRAVAKFSLSPLLRRDLCSSRSPHKRWNPNLAPNGVATLPPPGYKMLLPCEKTSLLIITTNTSWVIWAVQKRVNQSRYQDVVVVFIVDVAGDLGGRSEIRHRDHPLSQPVIGAFHKSPCHGLHLLQQASLSSLRHVLFVGECLSPLAMLF